MSESMLAGVPMEPKISVWKQSPLLNCVPAWCACACGAWGFAGRTCIILNMVAAARLFPRDHLSWGMS